MSKLTKATILNGQNPVQAVKDGDVVLPINTVGLYTPIVLEGIKAGSLMEFDLADFVDKNYQVLGVEADISLDNIDPEKNIVDDATEFRLTAALTIIRPNKRGSQISLNLNAGKRNEARIMISPEQKLQIRVSKDVEALTLWCQSTFIENQITPKGIDVTPVPEIVIEEEEEEGA